MRALIFIRAISFAVVLHATPKAKLSETGLYRDLAGKLVEPTHLSYTPQYPLWSDGAAKQRWLSLPPSTQIDTSMPDHWSFPISTKIWKEFSFPKSGGGWKRVETRLMEKLEDGTWEFSSYAWSEGEEDAILVSEEGASDVYPTAFGTKHDIPSVESCMKCHKSAGDPVLGIGALQLSEDRDPHSLHIEPIQDGMVSARGLADKGLLSHTVSLTARVMASTPVGRSAIGYLSTNCGSCHHGTGSAGFTGHNLHHSLVAETESANPAYESSVNQYALNFVIPGEEISWRILPGKPERSVVAFRMRTSSGGKPRMPSLGSKVVDQSAVDLIEQWIRQL